MRKAHMKLSRIIAGVITAAALAVPATANAFTPPPGGSMSGPTGACTIRGVKYAKIKANGSEIAFNQIMCTGAQGTFAAGDSSGGVFDPAAAGGTTGDTTGGTTGGTSGGGTATAPAPGAGTGTNTQTPPAAGAAGVCTIGGKQYGSAKMGPVSKAFDENMCKMAQGTFTAGGTSTAIFDASTVAPPAGGTPAAPGSTTGGATPTAGGGGSLASLIGGGSVPGVCKVSGVSYAKVEAMPGQSMPFMEMMCKGLPGGEWVAGGAGTATLDQTALRKLVASSGKTAPGGGTPGAKLELPGGIEVPAGFKLPEGALPLDKLTGKLPANFDPSKGLTLD